VTPLAARVAGIVRAPRATMARLCAAGSPPWLDVLALSTVLAFLPLAVFLLTPVGQTALVDQWERTAIAFGRPVDDAVYTRFQVLSRQGIAYAAGIALLTGPVLAGVVTVLLTGFLRITGRPASARVVIALVTHAGIILAIRQVIAAPLNYAGETLASPTTLVHLMSGFDETSPVARFLGVIDVFVLWWAGVVAVGVAAVAGRRVRPLVLTLTGVYVAVAVLLALAMAVTGGTS
jgi:hypothetical protein